MTRKSLMLATIGAALFTLPAAAHHSFAMFDWSKTVTLDGTIKDVKWAAPHVWITIDVPDDKGGTQEWGVEGGAPQTLIRAGWKRDTLKPGDKVTILGQPMRNGTQGAALTSVTLADGHVMVVGLTGGRPPGEDPKAYDPKADTRYTTKPEGDSGS